MSQCQRCGAKSQLWLCQACDSDLREMLIGLARGFPLPNGKRSQPWLEGMEDARLGRTRLGESARQSSERSTPLLVRLGPKHKWEGSPVEILKAFHGTMATWIRHLTESRGTTFRPVQSVPVWFIGPLPAGWRRLPRQYVASSIDCAEWLAAHVSAIACDEAAGELFNDVKAVVEAIERAVNRPLPGIECGPCPTIDKDQQECAVGLTAKRGAIEVCCWKCKTTHNIERLIQRRLNEVPNRLFNARDVLKIMARIGEPIGDSTWRRWRALGTITPAGELYGEPGYRLQDVKDQRRRYGRAEAS